MSLPNRPEEEGSLTGRRHCRPAEGHRGQQLLYKIQLGDGWNELALVFPGPFGKPLDLATLTRNFEKLARKAGNPNFRLHDLRHAHAAGLLKTGANHKHVQERLGHASAAFTMSVMVM